MCDGPDGVFFYIWIIWGTGGTHGKVPALPLPTHFCSFVCCPESFAPSVSDINKSGDIFVLLPEWPQSLRCCKFLKLEQRVWFRQRGASILHKAPQGMCYSYGNICEREREARTHGEWWMEGKKRSGCKREMALEREKLKEEHGERQWQRERNTEVHIVHVVSTPPRPLHLSVIWILAGTYCSHYFPSCLKGWKKIHRERGGATVTVKWNTEKSGKYVMKR